MKVPTLPETHIGERNYMRGLLGRETRFSLLVEGDVGPDELKHLVALLRAQIGVLEDERAVDIGHLEPIYAVPGDATSPIVGYRDRCTAEGKTSAHSTTTGDSK